MSKLFVLTVLLISWATSLTAQSFTLVPLSTSFEFEKRGGVYCGPYFYYPGPADETRMEVVNFLVLSFEDGKRIITTLISPPDKIVIPDTSDRRRRLKVKVLDPGSSGPWYEISIPPAELLKAPCLEKAIKQ